MRRRSAVTSLPPCRQNVSLTGSCAGSWHLCGSRTRPGPLGRWPAITRTVPGQFRTIVAAIRSLPFRRAGIISPNRFFRQPPRVDNACALARSNQGGAILFVLAGDYGRVEAKYGARDSVPAD